MIHIIYMAGGNSRRFGSNKLMYELEGKPLYRHCLDRLLCLLSEEKEMTLTVVSQYPRLLRQVDGMGKEEQFPEEEPASEEEPVSETEQPPAAEEKSPEKNQRLQTVYSENSFLGASYTIKAGLEAVQGRYGIAPEDALLFIVADQPYLTLETLRKFPETWRQMSGGQEQRKPAVTAWGSRQGNPCLFPAELVPDLLALTGDQGGKRILRGKDLKLIQVEAEKELLDIDSAEDLV